jgi:hypothetical protein
VSAVSLAGGVSGAGSMASSMRRAIVSIVSAYSRIASSAPSSPQTETYAQYGREQAEVLVDCVTYIVCSSLGLDVGGESIP